MATFNWGRAAGAGLSTLGQLMQEAEERRRREKAIVDERQRAEQAQVDAWKMRNPHTYDANFVNTGGMTPVGVPGYQPQEARTDLGGMLALRRAFEPPAVKPADPMDEIVPVGDPRNPLSVPVTVGDLVQHGLRSLPKDDTPPPRYDYPGAPGPVTMDQWIRLFNDAGGGGGGGGGGTGDGGPSRADIDALRRRYFGTQNQELTGQRGTSYPSAHMAEFGPGPRDAADAAWLDAVTLGKVDPFNTAQADSIVGEYLPPLDKMPNELDLWDQSRGVFVDKRGFKKVDVGVERAREVLAELLSKSPDKTVEWPRLRNTLRSRYKMSAEDIARVLPAVGQVSSAPAPPAPGGGVRGEIDGVMGTMVDGVFYPDEE